MRGRLPNVVNCVCGGKARIDFAEVGFYVRCEFDPGFASATEYTTPKRAANAWNKAQEEMEQLTRDVVCAYHRRKSYGQYIAGVPVTMEERPAKPEVPEPPDLRCVCCGLVIPAESTSKKYCSPACAERYREEQQRLRQSRLESACAAEITLDDDRPRCLECGKPIPRGSKKFKYCCAECADKALERQKAGYAKKRKSRGGKM